MMDPTVRSDINVRSARYFIAHTVGTCWHCNAPTSLFALALPPGHEALEWEDAPEETAEDVWSLATRHAFLFYVEYVPEAVREQLAVFTRSYRFGHSEAVSGSYWANHCERCGSLLEDHELFCEPDGAFLPTSAAAAHVIHLLPIEETIEAAASGYAYEPQFFDAMTRG